MSDNYCFFIFAIPGLALDLNAFRAQHGRPVLSMSVRLSGLTSNQANVMAGRSRIDHKNFRKRLGPIGTTHAENVLFGCDDQAYAISNVG